MSWEVGNDFRIIIVLKQFPVDWEMYFYWGSTSTVIINVHYNRIHRKFDSNKEVVCCSLLVFGCLDDLPIKGTRQTPTRGYKHQAGNNQSLSYKHWFNVYDYELHNLIKKLWFTRCDCSLHEIFCWSCGYNNVEQFQIFEQSRKWDQHYFVTWFSHSKKL